MEPNFYSSYRYGVRYINMTIIIYNLVHYECQGKASFIYSGKPSSQQAAECGRDSELSDGLDDCVFKYSNNFFIFFL